MLSPGLKERFNVKKRISGNINIVRLGDRENVITGKECLFANRVEFGYIEVIKCWQMKMSGLKGLKFLSDINSNIYLL